MHEKWTKFYEVVSADAGGGCACFVIGAVKGCGCVIFGGAKDNIHHTGTLCLLGIGN